MRDDLHKPFATGSKWRKVVRLASSCDATDPELRAALIGAVKGEASWLGTSWNKAFKGVFEVAGHDLFVERKVRARLLELSKSAPDHHAAAACATALGLMARDGCVAPDLAEQAVQEALHQLACNHIENVIARRVFLHAGYDQAKKLRRRLMDALVGCDLAGPVPIVRSRLSIDEALDVAL